MCILFMYTGEEDESGDYSLILASNRDESLARPAKAADYWEEEPTIIGGRDMEKGREGGTWLALSTKRARIGVILNLTGNPKPNGKGRGNIVSNYIKSELSTLDYVKELELERELYNDFNLVTVEIGKHRSTVHCYSNSTNELVPANDKWLGYGNSLTDTPIKKVREGRKVFKAVCEEYGRGETKDILESKLFGLLSWEEKHLPDEELKRRAPRWYQQLSSVYVNFPEEGYGSRAQTVVLVRKDGLVEFIERSMIEPIDPYNPKWQTARYHHQL